MLLIAIGLLDTAGNPLCVVGLFEVYCRTPEQTALKLHQDIRRAVSGNKDEQSYARNGMRLNKIRKCKTFTKY